MSAIHNHLGMAANSISAVMPAQASVVGAAAKSAGAAGGSSSAGSVASALAQSSAATGSSTTAASTTASSGDITSNDFLTLLVSELKNQDPTQPTDPNAYITQMVGVNSLQQLISINQELG